MSGPIDLTVYPDVEHGPEFADDGDRADYVMRVCAAWDFGVPPELATLAQFSAWRDVFDAYPLPRSPAYHAFRALFRWPALDIPESPLLTRWERSDAREDRDDPCRFET
jgi:hypothetical protein